jgi:hypothetical protein
VLLQPRKNKYFKRGVAMVENEANNAGKGVTNDIKSEIKKKKGFWGKFATFLMMGGFIVVLIVIVLIIVGISLLVGAK